MADSFPYENIYLRVKVYVSIKLARIDVGIVLDESKPISIDNLCGVDLVDSQAQAACIL
jgi:hypothetical protein